MKILICSLLKYPEGDAGSVRHHHFALMLKRMNHKVLVVSLGKSNGRIKENYCGVEYISLRQGDLDLKSRVISHLFYWHWLKKILHSYQPDAILMDNMGVVMTLKLKYFTRKHDIVLLHDSVEWFSPEQFKHRRLSRGYINNSILNRFLLDKKCKVIAISLYLYEYFTRKNIPSVRIPIVISETDLCKEKLTSDDKVVFTYAGQPGKKDYLHIMLGAFALLPQDARNKVLFNIVGCTKQQMIESGIEESLLDQLQPCLAIHGRVSRDNVLQILKTTDFTILMRSPEQRYAKAGFPTKVVESLSRSTPVICNLTSDLGMYLTDGENAFIVDECSEVSLKKQLMRAINMPKAEREKMYRQSIDTAIEYFDSKKYLDQLALLLN